ncbi:MAG: transposase [Silvanigrellaceae bacterium]|nr:transposase [Silvanigrellaceae bacterium]
MKPRYNWIPTELSQSDFNEFIFPHITSGRRGPKPKISYFKMFNYFLYLMHTGCQWYKLPIDKDQFGVPEISYSRLFRHFQHWINSGFFDRVFEASVAKLAKESLLETSVLHGDGTTTAAKKGGIILEEVATNI